MRLLSSAVRVQPVRRSGALRPASGQRAQRRRLGRRLEAGRGALSRQAVAHLFTRRAGFANTKVYEYLEGEGIKFAIRLPRNNVLQERIGYLLKRPVGRPSLDIRRSYANFTYQAGSCTKPRRIVAKVEWHPGELYPRVGFIVTNMARPTENVVEFYNKRGTCEQWIKEGKGASDRPAILPVLLGQRGKSSTSRTRLQSRQFPSHVGDPRSDRDWSLTSLKEKLIKIGPKVVSHGRYVAFQMAEVATPRNLFADVLRLIAELRQPPVTSTA